MIHKYVIGMLKSLSSWALSALKSLSSWALSALKSPSFWASSALMFVGLATERYGIFALGVLVGLVSKVLYDFGNDLLDELKRR